MSHKRHDRRMTVGGRAIAQVDGAAAAQRAAEAAPGIDAGAPRARDEAPGADPIDRHRETVDQRLGLADFLGGHLGEILGPQDLGRRHREPRVEFDRRRLLGLGLRLRLDERVGDAARPGFRLFRLRPARRRRRHQSDHFLDQPLALPEDGERLIEQQRVLVPLHENRMESGAEILLDAKARRLDRRDGVENRAGADRHAGVAQSAREEHDVFSERAARLGRAGRRRRVHEQASRTIRGCRGTASEPLANPFSPRSGEKAGMRGRGAGLDR